jgi:N-acetylglucosaminyl-diphospho-decaprenol L-rhamnosyltransferase
MPELSVIVVSYNTRAILERCLASLSDAAATAALDVELIIVDNDSTDGSAEFVTAEYPAARLLRNSRNRGFAAANNQGLARASAPICLLLNSDAFIGPATFRAGMDLLRGGPEIGMAGVRIDNPNGTLQAAYGKFPTLWSDICLSLGADRLVQPRISDRMIGPVDWVHGACIFVRTSALRDTGLLDERFFMYSEEVDWCRSFWRSGWEVWYLGEVSVVHLGGASHTNDLRRRVALYRGRLGLRRRLGGPFASALLWAAVVVGLGARTAGRGLAQGMLRRQFGRQSPRSDWLLACEVSRMDPLARWAAQ